MSKNYGVLTLVHAKIGYNTHSPTWLNMLLSQILTGIKLKPKPDRVLETQIWDLDTLKVLFGLVTKMQLLVRGIYSNQTMS